MLFRKTDSPATELVVVIPLTTTAVAGVAIARIEAPTITGITELSFAVVDKVTTVRHSNLGARVGRVFVTCMADSERLFMVFLGLAS
ncbi:hypothetical protein MUBE_12430 [Mycobacterium uberis]|uniref:Uncharacterized protein n=1 Tax=Mycobacterium uberis TaxID=2162698 RepID=A0A3E1HE38_9MYCO|nr:hypothetical protein MUBE_12430 [Mycobacterium uberis]